MTELTTQDRDALYERAIYEAQELRDKNSYLINENTMLRRQLLTMVYETQAIRNTVLNLQEAVKTLGQQNEILQKNQNIQRRVTCVCVMSMVFCVLFR